MELVALVGLYFIIKAGWSIYKMNWLVNTLLLIILIWELVYLTWTGLTY